MKYMGLKICVGDKAHRYYKHTKFHQNLRGDPKFVVGMTHICDRIWHSPVSTHTKSCSFFPTLWKPQVDNWCHSGHGKLCVMNWDFTDSLLTVVSLNLEWFEYREEPQRDITWSLDSIHLPSPFNIPILSPPTTPITTAYDIITCSKKAGHNLAVRNFYTHTMIANRWMNNWCKFRLHSLRHW